MSLKRLCATKPTEELLAAIDEDGGMIIEGLFPKDVIERLSDDVLAAADQVVPGAATQGLDDDGKEFVGYNTIRFSSLCLLYTSPSPRDATLSRMPSSA